MHYLSKYIEIDNSGKQEANIQEQQLSQVCIDKNEALERIRGSEELFVLLCKTFYKDKENIINTLEELIQKENWDDVKFQLHSVKGSAANISANPLSDAAAKFELAIVNNEFDSYPALFNEFKTQWQLLEPELLSIIKS